MHSDGGQAAGGARRRVRALALAVLAALLYGGDAGAQTTNGFIEVTASDSSSEVDTFGVSSDISSLALLQRYSVDATWNLFPHLLLQAGGLYERAESESETNGEVFDVTRETLRPFVGLLYNTPLYYADAAFYRLDQRLDGGSTAQRDIRDTFNVSVGWRPESFPWWNARYLRTETYDERRELRDLTDELIELSSEYSPISTVRLYYRGSVQEQEDDLEDLGLRFTSHTGRVSYGQQWWNRRLALSFEHNVDYLKREVRRGAGGEIDSPLPAIGGLSVLSEFPTDVELEASPALIDGNRTASAGINLGVPELGGDERPRNMGLDFGVEQAVGTLYLSVDRELPQQIAASFSWTVYSSADNRQWQLETVVQTAPFGPFENRFEIEFAEVTARYLKVVTGPLDRTVQQSEEFPLILVTELEAFERLVVDDIQKEPGLTTRRTSASLRAKLLKDRSLYYDVAFFELDPEDRSGTRSLSNALSFSQRLNETLSVSSRVAREDGREAGRDFVTYPYSAALRASWLPTLRQSLVFSGTSTDIEGETRDFQSLFLQTSAELYRGATADLGLGKSRSKEPDGSEIDATQVTGTATLVPHPTLSINLTYLLRESEVTSSGPDPAPARGTDITAGELGVGYRPFPALYLFWRYRLEEQPGRPDRTLENYNLSWSPFPGGGLQLSFTYDETFRSELDSVTRIGTANARWNLTSSRYLQLTYVRSDFGSTLEDRTQQSVQGSMRLTF